MVNNFYLDIYEHHYDLKMNYSLDELDDAIAELHKMGFEPERAEIVRSGIMREMTHLGEMNVLAIFRYSLKVREFKRGRLEFYKIAIQKLNHYIKSYSLTNNSPV